MWRASYIIYNRIAHKKRKTLRDYDFAKFKWKSSFSFKKDLDMWFSKAYYKINEKLEDH